MNYLKCILATSMLVFGTMGCIYYTIEAFKQNTGYGMAVLGTFLTVIIGTLFYYSEYK
jgi:hypothetical protein